MTLKRWTAVMAVTITSHLQAQTVASAPPPTMEQTVNFINDAFAKQGTIASNSSTVTVTYRAQSVQLENECSLIFTSDVQTNFTESPILNQGSTRKYVIHLDGSDPLSVTVKPQNMSTSVLYIAALEKAIVDWRALKPSEQGSPAPLSATYFIGGIVRSISGSSVTLVTDTGWVQTITLDADAEVSFPSQRQSSGEFVSAKGNLTDIAAGDHVSVLRASVDPKGKGRPKDFVYSQSVTLSKNSSSPQLVLLGAFTDKDLAERVAKAYIHAMVLCHKSGAPSLF
jgi:hypothetical protein